MQIRNDDIISPMDEAKSELIRINKLIKTYQTEAGDFQALKGINLTINKGEFVGIIGKSGSGKSTLINMITGIDHPTEGEVVINGHKIHHFDENQMAVWRGKNVGVVFQFFQLLPNLTVLENVTLPMDFCKVYKPEERETKALEMLSLVGVEGQADKFPSQLSGGQQQRVAIARALANDPPIVVADEPTGNLDSKTSEQVFELFEKLVKKGKTFIMVTHDTNLSKRVNRAIVIADGEVIEEYIQHSFPMLEPNQLAWVTKKMKMEKYGPGELIIKEGTSQNKLFVVAEGKVEILLETKDGQELVVDVFKKGEYFGEIGLLKGKSEASVRSTIEAPATVAVLEKEDAMKLLSESSVANEEIKRVAAERSAKNKVNKNKRHADIN